MSLAQPQVPERGPSPLLSSNNPFRNRLPSPSTASPPLPSPGLTSRNPFLAAFEEDPAPTYSRSANNNLIGDMSAPARSSPQNADFGSHAEELFKSMTLENKSPPNEPQVKFDRPPAPSRSGTMPIGHRPSRSNEDEEKQRMGSRKGPSSKDVPENVFASPPRNRGPRPRRNSDSSAMERPVLTEEELKAKERRRKERAARRERDGKDKDGKPRPAGKPKGLDLIDKLDVTGIYGGGLFHHDGPFDACNPHRNRRKDHRAPMHAFPKDSANNALGGSGPLNKNIDLDRFHGRETEGFNDYSRGANVESNSGYVHDTYGQMKLRTADQAFDAKQKTLPVHGQYSEGLGTSTFLEGAPASKAAMQRRESETEDTALGGGGLSRKKSLAQRIRGISQPRRPYGDGRIYSPGAMSPESPMQSGSISAGGRAKMNETNPFFDDYDDAYEKKGASIKISETAKPPPGDAGERTMGRARAPSSPKRGLTRTRTADSVGDSPVEPSSGGGVGGGLLSRMKSLKGGRRARPERRDPS